MRPEYCHYLTYCIWWCDVAIGGQLGQRMLTGRRCPREHNPVINVFLVFGTVDRKRDETVG